MTIPNRLKKCLVCEAHFVTDHFAKVYGHYHINYECGAVMELSGKWKWEKECPKLYETVIQLRKERDDLRSAFDAIDTLQTNHDAALREKFIEELKENGADDELVRRMQGTSIDKMCTTFDELKTTGELIKIRETFKQWNKASNLYRDALFRKLCKELENL